MNNPTGTKPLPFVKWAGGKRAMLPLLRPLVPPTFGTYHEPFVGGGALFFDQRPPRAVLSDGNEELVATYVAVRDDVNAVDVELRKHEATHTPEHFEVARKLRTQSLSPAERAARFIYLNRACFNGLYRVNKWGTFNVPIGRYKNPLICDEANLQACSVALQGVTIVHASFEAVLDRTEPGDFVYFDPPYMPVSATRSFASYTRQGFGRREHRQLRDVALELAARGVSVVVSNSNAPMVFDLYADGFDVRRVMAPRSISAAGESRGSTEEVVIIGPSQATAVECLVRLRTPPPDDPEPPTPPLSRRPEPGDATRFFPDLHRTFAAAGSR